MDIGIPKEGRDLDLRVGLGSNSVAMLVEAGNNVYIQTGAGEGAGFADDKYAAAGATVVYSTEEIYKRSQLICKVNTPSLEEIDEMLPGQIICAFAHLAPASAARFAKLLGKEVSVLAYEMLADARGRRPLLRAMSEMAGRLVPQIAAQLLESPAGRGLLLSGIPGLPPAEVCILGAGVVGFNAARTFAGMGAQVTVVDEAERLAELDRIFDVPGRIRCMYANPKQIRKAVSFCDVLVGAVLHTGARAPHMVSEEMVKGMRPGSTIIDVSIDQGGCVATSRPTTLRDPTFVAHGVTHYCVPNFTALVARTASRTLSNVLRPYLLSAASSSDQLLLDPELRSAVVVYNGKVTNPRLAATQNAEYVALEELA